jgi:NitT/TauT family transport system ATP-binding protein
VNITSGITIDRLSVKYDTPAGQVHAVDAVSLTVRPGEFICLVGPSGCGKTTLLNVVAGFVQPTAGQVSVGGKGVGERGTARGMVFQDYSQLFPWRTARRNVEFGLEARAIGAAERSKEALRHLAMVKLERFADNYPHQLSGGMQQRVAIARALAYNPALLLMDEPFGALDALTRDEVQKILVDVWQETGKTVLYVTHNVAEAVYLADRIIVMSPHPGRIQADIPVPISRYRDPLSDPFIALQRQVLQLITGTPAAATTAEDPLRDQH